MDDSSDRMMNKCVICAEKLKNTNAIANEDARGATLIFPRLIYILKKIVWMHLRWLNQIANGLTHKPYLF